MYSFKPTKNVVATYHREWGWGKKQARADTIAVTLLTSSQMNSQVSPVWLPMSCWSLGDREEVVSSGLCVHLRAEMKLHRQCFVCCHAELYLHPKLLWLLGRCCCLTTHPISPIVRAAVQVDFWLYCKKNIKKRYHIFTIFVEYMQHELCI